MRAVIFGLDGTLIHSRIDFKKMKSMTIDFLQSIGVTPGLLNDHMLNFEILRLASENLRGKGFSEEAIRQFMVKVTDTMNRVELESWNEATIIDGVPGTLRALKAKGLKIGIITNGCREYAEKVLSKFGLGKYVDDVAARDDVERPKPNPEHALHLLRLLGVSAQETLFVGNHWLDAECAKRSGLNFVLVAGRDQSIEALKEARYQAVSSIKDIVNIVNVMSNNGKNV